MKAYFIGGPLDLTIREIGEDRAHFEFIAESAPRPIAVSEDLTTSSFEVSQFVYRRLTTVRDVERYGNEIAIYICNPTSDL